MSAFNNTSSYLFNSMGRIGIDITDQTAQNLYNTRFGNYMVSNYFSDSTTGQQVQFATQQPTIMLNAKSGVAPGVVDQYSFILQNTETERPLEKLCLNERLFRTVPYLGRGSGDPTLESQLLQGECISDKKSVSTVSELSYMNHANFPMMDDLKSRIGNPAYSVEEAALDGWVRGGSSARDVEFTKNARPNANGY